MSCLVELVSMLWEGECGVKGTLYTGISSKAGSRKSVIPAEKSNQLGTVDTGVINKTQIQVGIDPHVY